MTDRFPVAILGASGYVGAELLRLALGHPRLEIAALGAKRQAGVPPETLFPRLSGLNLPPFVDVDEFDGSGCALVFCCLPHSTTQETAARLVPSVRVVDTSADFRLRDLASYAEWYGTPHLAPELQRDAVYGLTEHARAAIGSASLVACPGCYPTSALLPLLPLLSADLIQLEPIVIDSKSGVSGAGRALREDLLFAEVSEGVRAYGLGGHRHTPEIEQELSGVAGSDITVTFVPHLVPMNRGILTTIYVSPRSGVAATELQACLEAAYAAETFVQVLPPEVVPATREVRGSNQAHIGVADGRGGQAVLICALDNLLKGAAGQAMQNANVMLGLSEDIGLLAGTLAP